MSSREDFEAWARNRFGRGMVIQASNGPYVWDSVQDAWDVWQAATERAAKLVEARNAGSIYQVRDTLAEAIRS